LARPRRTTARTLERREYVPLDTLLGEIRRKLESGAAIDYITLGGSGEPTLHSGIGALIGGIRSMTAIPIAVITNGSLLWDADVRKDLLGADIVMPSLDAPDPDMFVRVNRPHPAVSFDRMVEGLAAFREQFRGPLWLEIFLLDGITANEDAVARFIPLLKRIRPDRIQLNTVARPSPGAAIAPVPLERMAAFARLLGPNAEVIAHYVPANPEAEQTVTAQDILDVVRRHPCSLPDIGMGLGVDVSVAETLVAELVAQGAVRIEERNGAMFYLAV
jgi:wyosine [tRNA(Phe)-imidazoG37] synthetase (radical SAM superfamily)